MNTFILKRLLLLCFICGSTQASAEEGMWTITNLDSVLVRNMKAAGLTLTGTQLYNETKPALNNAVLMFDNDCSASFVSADGLLLTNHHCARDRVQQLSTEAHNYIRDGYWATSPETELPVKGLTVKYLVKSIDLTAQVTGMLKSKTLRRIQRDIEKQYADTLNGLQASLDGFTTGQYFLSVYRVFSDVRLVGIPPESVGNFGGEAENFEWPRQTADFAVFRVYANAQNLPEAYAVSNMPYRPENYLPLTLKGVHDNDFVMTAGFPFSTQRNVSSCALDDEINVKNRATVLTKGKYIQVLKKEMDNDEAVRLKYSSKNFNAGNSYKLALGIVTLVEQSGAVQHKKDEEVRLQQWLRQDSALVQKYGHLQDTLLQNYAKAFAPKYAHAVITGALFGDASLWGIRARHLVDQLKKNDREGVEKAVAVYRQWYASFSKNYDVNTDRKVATAMIKLVRKEVKPECLPAFYKVIDSRFGGDVDRYVAELYEHSLFVQPARLEKFLKKPSLSVSNDPMFIFGTSIYDKLIELKTEFSVCTATIRATEKNYQEAMRMMNADKLSYPDANFTLRLTYGKVEGAVPRDGLQYLSRTTIDGMMAKEDSTDFQFYVWPKLKTLFREKDYGRYVENGTLYTCFLSSTDITGGNSGSPVINHNGELVGLAFDGNFESLAGDYIYEPQKNRAINVDIRYVLFIIDKLAGNKYIINNLNIK